jgi:Uma2 family endonuclease
MNNPLDLKLDKQAFLNWAEGREGRYELKDHRIFMMTGASRNHWRVVSAFTALLRNLLDPSSWEVGASDLAVEIKEDVRYPDVIVERAGGDGAALSTSQPVAIVEVLSPSSLALDFNVKAHEYMSLPSLEAYIVASQDEPRVWVWQRLQEGSGRAFPKVPEELHGSDHSIHVHALGVSLPLSEIYRGIRRT